MDKMKVVRFLIFLFLTGMVSIQVNAQFRAGIITGFNFSELDINVQEGYQIGSLNFDGRTVLGFGGIIEMPLSKTFAVRMEPMIIQKGGTTKVGVPDLPLVRADVDFKSSFIEIPVFLKAEFGNIVKPYLIAGPTIGILLSSKIEASLAGFTFNYDLKNVTKSIDTGFALGSGINVPIRRISLFAEGYYTFGFSNMQKNGTSDLITESVIPVEDDFDLDLSGFKYKNKGLKLFFGLTYNLN